MADTRIKILTPHSEECYLHPIGREEFICPDRDTPLIFRAKDGSKRGNSCTWHVFVCNVVGCAGRVMVRWDVLADIISKAITGKGLEFYA